MRILYDSKQPEHKEPFGCLRQSEQCRMMVAVPEHCRTKEVFLVLENPAGIQIRQVPFHEYEKDGKYEKYSGIFSLDTCGLYYYYFRIVTMDSEFTLFKENSRDTSMNTGTKWQVSCYRQDMPDLEGFAGKVMYQIFPDRFYRSALADTAGKLEPFWIHADTAEIPEYRPDEHGKILNNDFFGGNLRGITEKLDYLASLHVDILYLNPLCMAFSNHRYDTCDYKRVDPLLGTEEDFAELCGAAHQKGMRVILDGVFSHTGSRSVYFDRNNEFGQGAYHHPDSGYRSWYQFNDHDTIGYTSWWGIETLPCTNEMDDSFLDFIIRADDSVIAYWMGLGADGFRLDVADELPDRFIELLHERVKQLNPEAIVIGEVWEDASNKVSYSVQRTYFTKPELDAVMNYPYKDAVLGFVNGDRRSEQLSDTVMSIAENYPKPVLDCVMNSLSTHDTVRMLTALGVAAPPPDREGRARFKMSAPQWETALQKAKLAAFLQFTLPGTACVYYGDEIGMQGFEDPFNRAYFTWDDMNEELLEFYRTLSEIKHAVPALQQGDISVALEHDGVFAFRRKKGDSMLVCIVCMRDLYDCFCANEDVLFHNGRLTGGHLLLGKYGYALIQIN